MAAVITGKLFKVVRGENLSETFGVKDEAGVAVQVHTLYTVTVAAYRAGAAVTTVSVTTNVGETMTLAMTKGDTTAADAGFIYGRVIGTLKSSAATVVNLAEFVIEVLEEDRITIPVDADVVRDDLNLGSTFSQAKILRAVRRAQDRANFLLPEEVRAWCYDNGWPQAVENWTRELAELYLEQKIYPDRQDEFNADIKTVEDMISNVTVDTDRDGIYTPGTDRGGGNSFQLIRTSV